MPVLSLVQAGLILMKVAGMITISWWLVFTPVWIGLTILLLVVFAACLMSWTSSRFGWP